MDGESVIEKLHLTPTRCPCCRAVLDDATCPERHGAEPRPGDHTVCAYCGNISVFTEGMRLRVMTPEEFRALPDDEAQPLARIALRVRSLVRMRRGRR